RQGQAVGRSSLNIPAKNKESKMVHITLNFLIIPIGGFFELLRDEVIQAIPICTSQDVSALETAI
ncbi:hypothetical protein RhiirC2_750423, partial [Rhizophagus irregularis]